MKKAEDKRIIFNLILARSNPVFMRQISIPGTYTPEELTAAVCIAFGIHPVEGELSVEEAHGDTIEELFSEKDRGVLVLPKESGRKTRAQLSFFIDKVSETQSAGELKIPQLIKRSDHNMPAEVWDIRDINRIMMDIYSGKTAAEHNNTMYYASELAVSDKKTDNAMRKRFAPETARREVNSSIKLPMRSLVGGHKLDTLKSIADRYGIYIYAGMRKAEIVERICSKYDREAIEDIFDMLSLAEYEFLKQFLLDESDKREDRSTEEMLDCFYDRGLICNISGKGYCIASEAAEYFEELYESPKESSYIKIKYLKAAIKTCAYLYGIFSYKMFDAVLGVLNADGISEKEKREYFLVQYKGKTVPAMSNMDTDVLCYNSIGYREKALKLKRSHIWPEGSFYLPDKETIKEIDKNGIRFGSGSESELAVIIRKYRFHSYYGEDSSMSIVRRVEEMIHWGCSEKEVMDYIENNIQKLINWESHATVESVTNRIRKILKKETKDMPLVMLKGYTIENCPRDMKRFYQQEMEKIAEEEKKQGSSSGRRETIVKKRFW